MIPASQKATDPQLNAASSAQQSLWSPRRLIALLGGGLVLVGLILFGSLAYGRWQATQVEVERMTVNLADLLAEHAGRLFDASNLVANQAALLIAGRDWGEAERSEVLQASLLRISRGFDYISAVWLVDRSGRSRLTTRGFPAPDISVADRKHFQAHRDADANLFITRLLRSRIVDEPSIVLSRRIEDGAGQFAGAALVVLDPNYFLTFYRSINITYPVMIDLFRADLAVVIHYPEVEADKALSLEKWPDRTDRIALGESGTIFHARDSADQPEALESYQRIKGFPFYISVGVPRAAMFQHWLQETLQQAIFAGAALLALLLLVGVAMSRARREEVARAKLEALNQTLEQRVHDRTSEVERSAEGLRQLLAEKDVLFREVHHRVKNNLQIISSLLNLYANKFASIEVQRSFTDCLNQVRAMGLVHELLYRSPNVAEIDFDEYLRVLASRLLIFFGRGTQVRLNIRSAPLHFDLETTIPLALIVTEAITNAFKHAFPDGRSGTIDVEVSQISGKTSIRVSDDGVGMPPDWEELQTRSLGLKLLRVLAEQIDADFSYETGNGTTVRLVIDTPAASGEPHGGSAVDPVEGRPTNT
jgi:two-component sensor histidine kinase